MENEPKFKKIADGANDLSLGISMVVAVLLGVGVGILMRDLFNTPWLFWLGVFWGIAGAFLNVYKAYEKQKKSLEELANDPKYKNYKAKDDDEDDKY